MKVTLERGRFGWDYILRCEDDRTVRVELDHEYPSLASHLGWSHSTVQKDLCKGDTVEVRAHKSNPGKGLSYPDFKGVLLDDAGVSEGWDVVDVSWHGEEVGIYCFSIERCPHDGTDGTIDCPCGMKAADFIQSAKEWLNDHVGESFDDPGYF